MLPVIKGFVASTLIDWDGKIAAVVFLPGCNFRCPHCHASALVTRADELPAVEPETIRANLTANKGWVDGVVICGGEPTIHPGLPELCEWLREMGLAVKLDTNGSRPEVVEELVRRRLVDFVSMDVKAPFDERYPAATRTDCDVEALKRSVQLLIGSAVDQEFRTTVCPAVTSEQDVLDIARALQGARSYVLQQFRPVDCIDPAMDLVTPLPMAKLRELAAAAAAFVPGCHVRGDPAAAR